MGCEGWVTAYMVDEVERIYAEMWPGLHWQDDLSYANDPADSKGGQRRSVLRLPDGTRLLLSYEDSNMNDGWGNSYYFRTSGEEPIPVPDESRHLDLDVPYSAGEAKRGYCHPSQLRFLSVVAACKWSQAVEVWT